MSAYEHDRERGSSSIVAVGVLFAMLILSLLAMGGLAAFFTLRSRAAAEADPGDVVLMPDKLWGNYRLRFEVQQGAAVKTFPFYAGQGFNVDGFREALAARPGLAAPYAAMVMDARSGEVLHSRNADTRLHPASLTKMMTLYIAFEAVENGEISLDTMVRISKKAAAEPPSKLGPRLPAASVKSSRRASYPVRTWIWKISFG